MWGQFVIDTSHTKILTCILAQHMYMYKRTYNTHVHTYMYVNTHTRTHAHICAHTRTHTHARTYTHSHITHTYTQTRHTQTLHITCAHSSLRKEGCSVEEEADG